MAAILLFQIIVHQSHLIHLVKLTHDKN